MTSTCHGKNNRCDTASLPYVTKKSQSHNITGFVTVSDFVLAV